MMGAKAYLVAPPDFQESSNVSHETIIALEAYVSLLDKWNRRINLTGPGELEHVWTRHIADSLQIAGLLPDESKRLVDLGSGAGFPGLIVAAAKTKFSGFEAVLIENNHKKCAFLREAARIMKVPARIICRRIEDFSPGELRGDVVSARALAPLDKLLGFASAFLGPESICFFHKGQYVDDELTGAAKYWNMSSEKIPSKTDSQGCILMLRNIERISGQLHHV